jgi:hypothetical protein
MPTLDELKQIILAAALKGKELAGSGADYLGGQGKQIAADPGKAGKALLTGLLKGSTVNLAGMPVDAAVNVYNLGKAGVGYAGSKLGLPADALPELTEKSDVPGSSDWLANQVRGAGGGKLIDAPEGSPEVASMLGEMLAPGPKGARGPKKMEVTTYHATPHTFNRYDLSKAGTTTDVGMEGRGIYLSGAPEVSTDYNKLFKGNVYTQELPDEVVPRLLDWNKPIAEQPEFVRKALTDYAEKRTAAYKGGAGSGEALYNALFLELGGGQQAGEYLRSLGIPGSTHMNPGWRKDARNYVIWDQDLLDRMPPTPYE